MTMRICHRLVLLAMALLLPSVAGAQHFPSEQDLTELIRSRVEEDRGVGIVIGVLEADGSTHIVSYGDAGPGARALDAKSVFEIGSSAQRASSRRARAMRSSSSAASGGCPRTPLPPAGRR